MDDVYIPIVIVGVVGVIIAVSIAIIIFTYYKK